MTRTFEMNGKSYETDAETLDLLRSVMPSAKANNDFSAVAAIMAMGERSGRIVETAPSMISDLAQP